MACFMDKHEISPQKAAALSFINLETSFTFFTFPFPMREFSHYAYIHCPFSFSAQIV